MAVLAKYAQDLRDQWLAPSSRTATNSTVRQWLVFCREANLTWDPKVGVTDQALHLYISYLYLTGRSYRTIKNYLSMGVRVLCLENGIPWVPIHERPSCYQTLRGIRRILGDSQTQKLGITLAMLRSMRPYLDLSRPLGATVWAAFLTAFFGLFRKGNITARTEKTFNPAKDIRRCDLIKKGSELAIIVRHSKTIQFGQRQIEVKLPCFRRMTDLCPTRALLSMLALLPAGPQSPLFQVPGPSGHNLPLTHQQFVSTLKGLLKRAGIDERQYSGHSFRRGGASWLHEIGVSETLIKIQGDWASDAYLLYVSLGESAKSQALRLMETAADAGELGDGS